MTCVSPTQAFGHLVHARTLRTLRTLILCSVAAATLAIGARAAGAQSGYFTDPSGDLLPTYTRPHNLDLDVLTGAFQSNGSAYLFSTTMAGPIGITPGGLNV